MQAGRRAVTATFWLLDAPDNLAEQSWRNPDGTGLGVFGPDGAPVVHKEPVAAWQDSCFATEAHDLTGTTFVAHVRYASTGSLDVVNTHPFLQDGRIFAHNGVLEDLDVLDAKLRDAGVADLVLGQTDSERAFALITAAIRDRGGDVEAGLVDAVRWLAANVAVYALNVLVATATDLWAVRYPETHDLYVLDRRATGRGRLRLRSTRIRADCDHLAAAPAVIVASEPMDGDPRWSAMVPGELVHVAARGAATELTRRIAFPDRPVRQLTRADLSAAAAASQHPQATP